MQLEKNYLNSWIFLVSSPRSSPTNYDASGITQQPPPIPPRSWWNFNKGAGLSSPLKINQEDNNTREEEVFDEEATEVFVPTSSTQATVKANLDDKKKFEKEKELSNVATTTAGTELSTMKALKKMDEAGILIDEISVNRRICYRMDFQVNFFSSKKSLKIKLAIFLGSTVSNW